MRQLTQRDNADKAGILRTRTLHSQGYNNPCGSRTFFPKKKALFKSWERQIAEMADLETAPSFYPPADSDVSLCAFPKLSFMHHNHRVVWNMEMFNCVSLHWHHHHSSFLAQCLTVHTTTTQRSSFFIYFTGPIQLTEVPFLRYNTATFTVVQSCVNTAHIDTECIWVFQLPMIQKASIYLSAAKAAVTDLR